MPATATVLHLVQEDDEDFALCGAALKPLGTPEDEQDWVDQRDDATCVECTDAHDEAAFDRQSDRGYSAEDYALDRAVERSRGIE